MKELENLIAFWTQHLGHNRHIMSQSIIWQVERTITFLKELLLLKGREP